MIGELFVLREEASSYSDSMHTIVIEPRKQVIPSLWTGVEKYVPKISRSDEEQYAKLK